MTEREMFEASFGRPNNYFQLSAETQWDIDKNLGILDWNGDDLLKEDVARFKNITKNTKGVNELFELLNFIFKDAAHFIGTVILLAIITSPITALVNRIGSRNKGCNCSAKEHSNVTTPEQ